MRCAKSAPITAFLSGCSGLIFPKDLPNLYFFYIAFTLFFNYFFRVIVLHQTVSSSRAPVNIRSIRP